MTTPKAFDLNQLFEGSLRRLRTDAEFFSRLTEHNPELGRLNETHLVKLLRDYLPPKFGIGTGFIACGGSHASQSPQCDIIIYDSLNNAPLYKSDAWSIYPIEMVYGVIEVKTSLNVIAFKEAFQKCATIRAMARTPDGKANKAYIRRLPPKPKTSVKYQEHFSELPPRFFIFGYKGWKSAAALEDNFKRVSEENGGAHVHGVCCLQEQGSLYICHEAYKKGEERFLPVSTNGFRNFLMTLPSALESMLPTRREGRGFDQVNLKHYDLSSTASG